MFEFVEDLRGVVLAARFENELDDGLAHVELDTFANVLEFNDIGANSCAHGEETNQGTGSVGKSGNDK